jgi:lysozyme
VIYSAGKARGWGRVLNHSLEDQLILHEGLRLEAYKCPAGFWTIGVGRNLEDKPLRKEEQEYIFKRSDLAPDEVIEVLKERGITKDEALFLLRRDIQDCEQDLKQFDWFDRLDPVRRKVVLDMRFNLGPQGFRQFKRMIEHLAAGRYSLAAGEMVNSRWYLQVGNRSKRLVAMMRTGEDYTN